MKSRNTKLVSLFLIVALLLAFLPSASAANVELTAEQDAKAIIPVTDSFLTDSGCQIGRYIDTVAFKEKNHVSRLKADEDVNTYVFLNEDNTKTVYYLDEAVKFVDDDGYIREKNTDLTYHVTGFSTAQNDVGLEIPTLPSSGISLSLGENQIKLYPLNGYPLSAAIRNGNSVDYPYFYGLGTTLRYTPTLSGVKEDIILSSYNGVHEFSFRITTGGLNLYQVNNRYYLAETEDADIKFWLGCVEIFDANARPGYGTMTAETVEAGQEYILTLSADPAFLTDPNTVYPVTIDPTLTASNNGSPNTQLVDAPIFEGFPDSNFGNYQYNHVGYLDSTYKTGRTVVRLNGLLNDPNFLTSASVHSATFYIADASGSAATTVKLYPLTSNSTWTENNVTWNNIGNHYFSSSASASMYYGEYSAFNITSLVNRWESGSQNPDCGFILISNNESSTYRSLISSEHSNASKRPYFTVSFNIFALSGAELPYHPNCWNNHVNENGDIPNCYSYALNYWEGHLLIGELDGTEAGSALDYETVASEIMDDLSACGLEYLEDYNVIDDAKKYDPIPDGTYRIAVCFNHYDGYHFFRQNPDGTWSQKDGDGPVTNLDRLNNIIYNPEKANINYQSRMVYLYIKAYPRTRCSIHTGNCSCGYINNSICSQYCPYICNCT